MAERSALDNGLAVRREVLGAEHVERSLDGATAFSRPMQEFVTEHCWGAVLTRPSRELRERSIRNLGIVTALGRRHELGVHVRGALNNGVTPQEIREVLLQAGIYAGMPAAMEAFRVAEEVLAAEGVDLDAVP
jgi:4-carboxymuconolactone decarboxylase